MKKINSVAVELRRLTENVCHSTSIKASDMVEFEHVYEPPEIESVTQNSSIGGSESCSVEEDASKYEIEEESQIPCSFLAFRLNFLFVTLVVMLADGLQGTNRMHKDRDSAILQFIMSHKKYYLISLRDRNALVCAV
jgi:hypothetical protein